MELGDVAVRSSKTIGVGNILSLGITEDTPYGYLAVVTSASQDGDSYNLEVEEASIEEAFETLDVEIESFFSPDDDDVKFIQNVEGVYFKDSISRDMGDLKISGNTMTLELVDIALYESGDNKVILSGEIVVQAKIKFDYSLVNETLSFSITPSVSDTLCLTGNYDSGDIEKEIELGKISKTFTFIVDGLPVLITTEFFLNVGFNGRVTADLESEVSACASFSAGIDYDGEWKPSADHKVDFTFKPPTINSELTAKAYVQPGFSLMLYNMIGPVISWEPYLKIEASALTGFEEVTYEPFFNPEWYLYGGHLINAGCKVSLMGVIEKDFDHEFPIAEELILSSLDPPSNVQLENSSFGPVISWDSVEEANYYEVYRSLSSDSGYSLIGTVYSRTYTDPSVIGSSTVYHYRIKAVSTDQGHSPPSGEVDNSSSQDNAPTAPSNLNITYMDTEPGYTSDGREGWLVKLSWSDSVDPNGYTVYYTVLCYDDEGNCTGVNPVGTDPEFLFNAIVGTTYNLVVSAQGLDPNDPISTIYNPSSKSEVFIFSPTSQ